MILDVLWGILHSNSLFYTFCGEISEISVKHPFARLKCVTIQFLMCHSLDEKSKRCFLGDMLTNQENHETVPYIGRVDDSSIPTSPLGRFYEIGTKDASFWKNMAYPHVPMFQEI